MNPSGPRLTESEYLRILREFETICCWRKAPSSETVSFSIRSTPDRLLGYGVFLENQRGQTYLAQTLKKTSLLDQRIQDEFEKYGHATLPVRLLAQAVAVVYYDMLTYCRTITGELTLERDLLEASEKLFAETDVNNIALFGKPENHFEQRVNLGLMAFSTSLAISKDPGDQVVRDTWDRVVENANELYYALADFEQSERTIFDIRGAPTLFESLLYTLNTLWVEYLPNTRVVKRCMAHLHMQSLNHGTLGQLPLPEAIRDAFTRVKLPFIGFNAFHSVTLWSGEYVNDRGAVNRCDGITRQLNPNRIFAVDGTSCVEMDLMLDRHPGTTDSNGLAIALICATSVLSSFQDRELSLLNLALCIADYDELSSRYSSGSAIIGGVNIIWDRHICTNEQGDVQSGHQAETISNIVTAWTTFLRTILDGIKAKECNQALPLMPELAADPGRDVMHYQNMNMFRKLTKPMNTTLELMAKPPLGGHLLDCGPAGNYYKDMNRRKRRVIREGTELKVVKKWGHRVIYYVSRVSLKAGQYELQMNLEDVLINRHTSTRQILELMMDVGQDYASTSYALKFIEDCQMKFDNRSASFLPRHTTETGPALSAVLSKELLSSVDCLVKPSTGDVYILINVRLLKLKRVGPGVLETEAAPKDVTLRRCRIQFDSVVG